MLTATKHNIPWESQLQLQAERNRNGTKRNNFPFSPTSTPATVCATAASCKLPWLLGFGKRDFVAVITGPRNPRRTLCLNEVGSELSWRSGIPNPFGPWEKKANWVVAGPLMLSQFVRICCGKGPGHNKKQKIALRPRRSII